MKFTWPLGLLALLSIPLLVALTYWFKRRKKKVAVRFSNVALMRAAMPTKSRWRRLLPIFLFFFGLGSVGIASARPQASLTVPIGRTTIMLALDVSRSMCANDILPNRLAVAQDAARSFVEGQPRGTRIGIVAFAGFAELVVAPTTDKKELLSAIDAFTTARGTAIGAATLTAIDAISTVNNDVAPVGVKEFNGEIADTPSDTDATGSADTAPTDTVPPKSASSKGYVPDIIVLLTDGANTRGIEPLDAAKSATARGVRVYTIGFGTSNPTDRACTAAQLGGDAFGDQGFGGTGPNGVGGIDAATMRRFMVIDEPTLEEVAKSTGGKYYRAEDAPQLRQVFKNLPKQVTLQKRNLEISAIFAAVGAALLALAIALSMLWNRSP
jgi:Ca-activated chloride channel homolog